ncbi:MAG: hypothetical protein ACOC1L_00210 [Bacillota bacterium]
MAYVILKTKERKRRPVMQRLFMGIIVTMGLFFGYEYMFEQTTDVALEPNSVTSESIEYTIDIKHMPDDVSSFLLIVNSNNSTYQIAFADTHFTGILTELDADTAYSFTVYTVNESNRTKVYETEVITKEMVNNE